MSGRTKRGPTRPWSRRLIAEAEHLDALANRWGMAPRGFNLLAANELIKAARHVRAAAEHQEKAERER